MKSNRQKLARLSCRLDPGLKGWLEYYAGLRNVTLTFLVEDWIRSLRQVHEQDRPRVRQV
jgi:hypothetical protein